jgi:hypothetical protein
MQKYVFCFLSCMLGEVDEDYQIVGSGLYQIQGGGKIDALFVDQGSGYCFPAGFLNTGSSIVYVKMVQSKV